MPKEFKLQDPGEGVREVDILELFVSEGDEIAEGQEVMAVESDKAAIELPSPFGGRVAEIRVKEGDTAVVGDVLMVVEAAEEGAEATEPDDDGATGEEAPEPFDEDRDEAEETGEEKGETPEAEEEQDRPGEDTPEDAGGEDREARRGGESGDADAPVKAAPAARKLAREKGIDLADIRASGTEGQVTVEDVRAALSGGSAQDDAAAQPEETAKDAGDEAGQDAFGPVERLRMSSIRAATARAMARSWADIPHVTHEEAADITELERWRRRQPDDTPSLTAIVAKAVISLLQAHPRFNAVLDGDSDEIVLRRYYNLNIAVATDRGLVTPVVKGADAMSARDVHDAVKKLAEKAKNQKLSKDDLSGGTFTITNGGIFGSLISTPILNPPQTAILGMHKIQERPMAVNGQVVVQPMMYLALSYDHRMIDGKEAVQFLVAIKEMLEDPARILLDV